MFHFFFFVYVFVRQQKSVFAANIVDRKYGDSYDNDMKLEFIDVNGHLSDYIDYEIEILADGLGFSEGPAWINNDNGNDYLLFTEWSNNAIWKYIPNTKQIQLFMSTEPDCNPCGIGYNHNFNDEFWVSCFPKDNGGNVYRYNLTTLSLIKVYDHKTYNEYRDTEFQPNDIVIDDTGNVYFTDLPLARSNEFGARGGVYQIDRNTDKMTLIALMEWGPNGISLSNDQSYIVAANMIDYPIEEYDLFDDEQQNWEHVYIKAFKLKEDTGMHEIPFIYFSTHKEPWYSYMFHDQFDMLFDGNAFDTNDNLWQAVHFNLNRNGSMIAIMRNDGDKSEDLDYIGSVRIENSLYTPSNFEMGSDGYMYGTFGNWHINQGGIFRIKTKAFAPQKTEL